MQFAFWKKERKEIPIQSTESEENRFNESYNIISRNANFILVTNGVILSFFLASQENNIISSVLHFSDLLLVTFSDASLEMTYSSSTGISLFFFLLFSIILGSIFISMISCIACFDSGLYPRMGRRRSFQELVKREKVAIRHYRRSTIFLFFCFLGILNFMFAMIIGESRPVYIITTVLFVSFSVAILVLGLFSRFEDKKRLPSGSADLNMILSAILILTAIVLIILIFA